MPNENNTIWTIGHSTHDYERFIGLLRSAEITAIADVRSVPHSRHFSHFNRDVLKDQLRTDGIAYSFLGSELGGRPRSGTFYCEGVADYEKMATAGDFKAGLERVIEGAGRYRIALMCSEHDPLDCHRCLLVGRALVERSHNVEHILSNGQIVSHDNIEERLLDMAGARSGDLFLGHVERLAVAYRQRAMKVAYAEAPAPSYGTAR
jgi:uncharacterized protein (DUF488 family)